MAGDDVFQPSHGITKHPVRAQHPSLDNSLPCASPGKTSPSTGTCRGYHWGSIGGRCLPAGQPLTHGQLVPAALAADPQAGSFGVNGMLMVVGLGAVVPAWGGSDTPLETLRGQMGSPLPPPPPFPCSSAGDRPGHARCQGANGSSGGPQALIEQEA